MFKTTPMKKNLLFTFLFFCSLSYAQTGIWGVTTAGGHFNGGTIFRTDGSGTNYALKKSMFQYTGEYAKSNLFQASNGKLYGMTSSCCVFGAYGIFFQYDPVTKEYDKVVDFNDTLKGSDPEGGVIQASDGKLYGMTCKGGIKDWGVIFQYDPVTATFTKKFDFDNKNGSYPQGNLIQATDGKLYGLANTGGANDFGVLFQYDPLTATFTKKFDFDGDQRGSNPLGSLIQAKNGKLYGLTSGGGTSGLGTLFEYDPITSTLVKKIEFSGATDGSRPHGSLTEASDGNLYGLTTSGGANDLGVLFQYDPSSAAYSVKLEFNGTVNGANPKSSLVAAANGKLYGTTENGGAYEEGLVFEYDPLTSTFKKKIEFNDKGKLTGKYPIGSLTVGKDGMLYGMTYTGGIAGVGVLYKLDPVTSTFSKEFDFHASSNGSTPTGSLMEAKDKMLYGITQTGGLNDKGTIFQYDPTFDVYTKKFDFDGKSGAMPTGPMMQADDGKIYGTTQEGGTNDRGVLFQFDPVTATCIAKVEFDGTNGSSPYGELMQANNGKIYGMTREGGTNNEGVIFQFDPVTSDYSKKFDFGDNTANGKYPEGGLTEGADGKLYGVATSGGLTTSSFADGLGVLFQFDPATATYTKKFDFDGLSIGGNPNGTLMKTPNGKLYGLTTYGGTIDKDHPSGHGVLFQFDPVTSGVSGMLNFNGVGKGSRPNGSLLLASDGNFYGVTNYGGLFNMGVLFQVDLSSFTYTKKIDFEQPTGKLPNHTKLIEVALINSIAKNKAVQLNMDVYPNPAKERVTISLDQKIADATIKIISVSGQRVLEKTKLSGDSFTLNTADLSSGIYFIEVTEKENTSRLKLIKE